MLWQNKSKRAEVVRDGAVAPDTGQSPAEEQAKHPEEPQAAAASSPNTGNNTNGSNYNLVTSLLNLTKSPVSNSTRTPPSVLLAVVSVAVGWIGERCFVSGCPLSGWQDSGEGVRGPDAAGQPARACRRKVLDGEH